MKLIFVNRYFSPDQSATSRMITSLASFLAERDLHVVVLASRQLHDDKTKLLPRQERLGRISVHRLRTSGFGRRTLIGRSIDYLSFHILAMLWLLWNASRGDLVIVCTDPPLLSVTTGLALKLRGVSMVNWIMDLFPEAAAELGFFKGREGIGRLVQKARDWSLRTSRLTICPTATMARYLTRKILPRQAVAVLPHWADSREIYPVDRDRNTLRMDWGFSGRMVVGYSGNFGRAHDFSTLLQAAEELRDREDIVFLMIGGGYQHKAVVQECWQRGLKNVVFKPLQPATRLAESLGVPDIHLVSLLPALEHCIIPSKIYGIMAAGRPTIFIGESGGEVAQLLAKDDCGITLPIGAGKTLAATLLALRDDPDRLRAMGERARQAQVAQFSCETAAHNWSQLIAILQSGEAASNSVAETSFT